MLPPCWAGPGPRADHGARARIATTCPVRLRCLPCLRCFGSLAASPTTAASEVSSTAAVHSSPRRSRLLCRGTQPRRPCAACPNRRGVVVVSAGNWVCRSLGGCESHLHGRSAEYCARRRHPTVAHGTFFLPDSSGPSIGTPARWALGTPVVLCLWRREASVRASGEGSVSRRRRRRQAAAAHRSSRPHRELCWTVRHHVAGSDDGPAR